MRCDVRTDRKSAGLPERRFRLSQCHLDLSLICARGQRRATMHGAPRCIVLPDFSAALPSCAAAAFSPVFAQDNSLTVFAAASMKNALDDIDAAYTAKTGVKVVASYSASSALAKQIEQGAPADVFVSADTDWMDYATRKKTINESTRVNLLGNSIVLIAPKDSTIDHVAIGPGLRSGKARRRRQDRHRRRESGAGRQIRQGGAGKTRRVASGGTEIRDGGERARRADAGGARRSVARDCLCNRCQGRTRRQDRRHLPGGFPSRHHLSRRGNDDRKAGSQRTISPSCARLRRRRSSKNMASPS